MPNPKRQKETHRGEDPEKNTKKDFISEEKKRKIKR